MDRERFESLLSRCCPRAARVDAGAIFDEISGRYHEAHRRYHTPRHIRHCLGELDLAADLLEDGDAVEMALWFHDVVWEAQAPPASNERRSARTLRGPTRRGRRA